MRFLSLILLYAVTLGSSGLFAPVWLLLMMRDLNEQYKRPIFKIRSWIVVLLILFSLYISSVLLILFNTSYARVANFGEIGLAIFSGSAFLLTTIYMAIRTYSELRIDKFQTLGFAKTALLVIFTIFLYLSLPYLQIRINREFKNQKTGS